MIPDLEKVTDLLADIENTWVVKLLKTCFQRRVEKGWAKGAFLIAMLLILFLTLVAAHYPANVFVLRRKKI